MYLQLHNPPERLAFSFLNMNASIVLCLKYLGTGLFSVYAFLFLAVTVPFLPEHSVLIYITGIVIVIRFVFITYHCVVHILRYGAARLQFSHGLLILEGKKQRDYIAISDIVFTEYRFDNQFVIHTNEKKLSFPVDMIAEDAKLHLLTFFNDITPRRTRLLGQIKDITESIILALLLAVHIIWYAAQNYFIPTGSMRNTLVEYDHIFGEKISLGIRIPKMAGMKDEVLFRQTAFRELQREDIVVFKPPNTDNRREFIKRVIALPGETFSIHDGYVFINGKKLYEPYTFGLTQYHGDTIEEIEGIVPPDMYIVLGDNRRDSLDSRVFGYVPRKNIRSRAFFLYFNINDFKRLDFSRFGFIW